MEKYTNLSVEMRSVRGSGFTEGCVSVTAAAATSSEASRKRGAVLDVAVPYPVNIRSASSLSFLMPSLSLTSCATCDGTS